MHPKSILSAFAGVLEVAAFVPYIRAILQKKTEPEKATWIIWVTLDAIAFAGMLAKHTVNGLIVGAMFGAAMVAGLSLKYGKPGWTLVDKLCLGGAAIGIALEAFSDPMFGMMTSLVVMLLGSLPTFVSAWEDPARENRTAWTIFWVAAVLSLVAIPAMTIADIAQPVTFFTIESTVVFILYVRPRLLERAL